MLIVLVVGAFLASRANRARAQRRAAAAIQKAEGWIEYDFEYRHGRTITGGAPWAPAWFRKNLGEEFFREITVVRFASVERDQSGKKLLPAQRALAAAQLASIEGLDYLEELDYGVTNVSDIGMEHLRGLTSLRSLVLAGTRVQGSGLRHLERLQSLRELFLQGSALDDDGLAVVGQLAHLRSLNISGSQVTDAGLVRLRRLAELRELVLDVAGDAGLANLKGLHELEALAVNAASPGKNRWISDDGLGHLSHLSRLRILAIHPGIVNEQSVQITNAGLAHLARLRNLEFLHISASRITDAGLACLRGLKSLKRLELDNSHVTQRGMQELQASLPSLTTVSHRQIFAILPSETNPPSASPQSP
jgi:hypothetical protein